MSIFSSFSICTFIFVVLLLHFVPLESLIIYFWSLHTEIYPVKN